MDPIAKSQIKTLFSKATLFISLYENFLQDYEESILSLYSNSICFDEGLIKYGFTDMNGEPNKRAREAYEKAVHRTYKKNNGDWDRDLSMFNWLLSHGIITDEHFEQLKEIRLLRNKPVHELDSLLGGGFPEEFEEKLGQLVKIR